MITKNQDGTYSAEVYPNDEYWKSDQGQKFLKLGYPVDIAFSNSKINMAEYFAHYEEINKQTCDHDPKVIGNDENETVICKLCGEAL